MEIGGLASQKKLDSTENLEKKMIGLILTTEPTSCQERDLFKSSKPTEATDQKEAAKAPGSDEPKENG